MAQAPPSLGKALFALLFFGAVAVFLAVTYVGDLFSDLRVAGSPMVPSEARVLSADCTRYNFIVSACTIAYADPRTAQPDQRRKLEYLMFGSVAGERYYLLQPQSNPALVTSNTGLDHVGNRVTTLIGLLGTMVLLMFGALLRLRPKMPESEGASHNYDDALERALAAHAQAPAAGSQPAMASRAAPPRAGGAAKEFGRRVR